MDKGAWEATVYRVADSDMLSSYARAHTHTHTHTHIVNYSHHAIP